MRNMKKAAALMLVMAMTGTGLTACSGGAAETTASATKAPDVTTADHYTDEQVTLRFMWWGGDTRNEATQKIIDQYEAMHPNVTIEAEINSSDGYIDKVSTQLANETAPDIIQQMTDAMLDFTTRGDFFYDYRDYQDIVDLSGFEEGYLEETSTFGGKLIGLPTGVSGLGYLVNMDLAGEIGLDMKKQLTWDSLLEMGKQVQAYNPDMYLMNVDVDILNEYILRPYLTQITNKTFIDDESIEMGFAREQLVQALDYVQQCYDNGVFQPASESATFRQATQTNPKWINGEFVIGCSAVSNANLLREACPNTEFDIVQMPLAENRLNDGFFPAPPQLITVSKTCKYPEVAMDFLNYFFNSEEAARILVDVRGIPPVASSRELCDSEGLIDALLLKGVNISLETNGYNDKGLSTSTEMAAIIVDMLESVMYGQETPESAADYAIQSIEDFLAEKR